MRSGALPGSTATVGSWDAGTGQPNSRWIAAPADGTLAVELPEKVLPERNGPGYRVPGYRAPGCVGASGRFVRRGPGVAAADGGSELCALGAGTSVPCRRATACARSSWQRGLQRLWAMQRRRRMTGRRRSPLELDWLGLGFSARFLCRLLSLQSTLTRSLRIAAKCVKWRTGLPGV